MARLLNVALLVAAGALLYVTVSLFWPAPAGAATGTGTGPELESIGPITFGPDLALFLADNRAAATFALDAQALGRGEPGAAAVGSIGQKVAAMLGTDGRRMTIMFRVDGAGNIELVAGSRAVLTRRAPEPAAQPDGTRRSRRHGHGHGARRRTSEGGRIVERGIQLEAPRFRIRSPGSTAA